MPQLLKCADQLAAELQQEILMADFRTGKKSGKQLLDTLGVSTHFSKSAQSRFIEWLSKELPAVHFEKVFPPLDAWIIIPYMGHIGIVVDQKHQPESYKKIVSYWENEDGTSKFSDTRLFIVKPNKM